MMGMSRRGGGNGIAGFTLIELVLIILLLAILSVTVVEKWPTGMNTEAAALEFKRVVRSAQHMAMTRAFSAGNAWGLVVAASQYTIQRQDGSGKVPDFSDRFLLGDTTMSIAGGPANGLWFNGLGEPVDATGAPLGGVTYVIAGAQSMTVCPQTGYLVRGATCP